MFKKNKKKNKGFTLIETLIAISILMISVTAPLSLAANGLAAANLAKNQIVAYYLAQDAYEWIKNKTDNNKTEDYSYSEDGIIHGMNECVGAKCIVDSLKSPTDVSSIKRYTGQFLKKDNSVYSYVDGDDSIFKRYIEIKKIRDDGLSIDEVEVSVIIEWSTPYGTIQRYTLKGNISNW